MARTLRIPARVAVGFLRPEDLGGNRYEFSAHDMHAWPELYFPGSGWVRFEPTPAGGPERVDTFAPAYTEERLPDVVEPLPAADQRPAERGPPLPGRRRGHRGRECRRRRGRRTGRAGQDRLAGAARCGVPRPAGRAGLRAAGAAADAPRPALAHRWGARAAWAELHDTATDLGITWRPGLSPRATRARLVEHFGAPLDGHSPERPPRGPSVAPEAVEALDRIVHEVELLRYARRPGDRRRPRAALRHRPLRGRVVRRRAARHPAPGALVAPVAGPSPGTADHHRRPPRRRPRAWSSTTSGDRPRRVDRRSADRRTGAPERADARGPVGSEAAALVAAPAPPLLHALHEGAGAVVAGARGPSAGPAALDDGEAAAAGGFGGAALLARGTTGGAARRGGR